MWFSLSQSRRAADDERLTTLVSELMGAQGQVIDAETRDRLLRAIPQVKDGAKTLLDLPVLAGFALKARPFQLDEKTLQLLSGEGRERLQRLRGRLGELEPWTVEALEDGLRSFAADEGIGLGKIGPLLRGVLAGGAAAPDLAGTLFALRRDEALGRIDDALSPPA